MKEDFAKQSFLVELEGKVAEEMLVLLLAYEEKIGSWPVTKMCFAVTQSKAKMLVDLCEAVDLPLAALTA